MEDRQRVALEGQIARVQSELDKLKTQLKPKPPKRRFPWPAGPWKKVGYNWNDADGAALSIGQPAVTHLVELAPLLAEAAVAYYEHQNKGGYGRPTWRRPWCDVYDLGEAVHKIIKAAS